MKHKYRAKRTTYNDITFDSLLEARFYQRLELYKKAKKIKSFSYQARIPFILPNKLIFISDHLALRDFLQKAVYDDRSYETVIDYIRIMLNEDHNIKLTKTAKIETVNLNIIRNWILSHKSEKDFFLLRKEDTNYLLYKAKKIFNYNADFIVTSPNDRSIYIDTKGYKTPIYNQKKKLVEGLYDLVIHEVKKPTVNIDVLFEAEEDNICTLIKQTYSE